METIDEDKQTVPTGRSVRFGLDVKKRGAAAVPSATPSSSSSDLRKHRRLLKRTHQHVDIATGRRTTRHQTVDFVNEDDREARSRWNRVAQTMWKSTRWNAIEVDNSDGDGDEEDSQEEKKAGNIQYRINSHAGKKRSKLRIFMEHQSEAFRNMTADYLNWSFRSSFWYVALVSYAQFLALVLLFALFVYAVGRTQPQCLSVAGADFKEAGTDFMDAIHLSWTTISTVGFGVMSPSLASEGERCIGINLLMALEAFVGVLFASLVSAIVFSKIARIQSIAQVEFSDPICVRYGTGVMVATEEDSGDDEEGKEESVDLPCPILEFRLINLLSREKKGEIMSASVNVVASILENDEETEKGSKRRESVTTKGRTSSLMGKATQTTTELVGKASKTTAKVAKKVGSAGTKAVVTGVRGSSQVAKHTGAALLGAGKKATHGAGTLIQQLNQRLTKTPTFSTDDVDDSNFEAEPYNTKAAEELEKELEAIFAQKFAKDLEKSGFDFGLGMGRATTAVDEGNDQLAPPRTYHKLEIETDSHPFFKRVWNIRHVLNAQSPLLTLKARRMVQENKGFWPESLNDYESIRTHLRFNDIVVSFSGSANVSGATVFAQHVYDYVDVNVGYTFANVLALEGGKMIVDAALLNDVTEQMGGGAEPFSEIQGRVLGPAADALEIVKEGLTDATAIAGAVGTQTLTAAEHVATATKAGVTAGVTAVADQVSAAEKTATETIQGRLRKPAEEQDL